MSVRRLVLSLLLPTALLAGCAGQTSRCYVTIDPAGDPTAEACETGPHLIVRPLGETNAAYYVPPYVLGALRYEGFLKEADEALAAETRPVDGEAGQTAVADDRWLGLRWPEDGDPWAVSTAWLPRPETRQPLSLALGTLVAGSRPSDVTDLATDAFNEAGGMAPHGSAQAFGPPMRAGRAALALTTDAADALSGVGGLNPVSSGVGVAENRSAEETFLLSRHFHPVRAANADGKEPRLGAASGKLAAAYAAGEAWRKEGRLARPFSVAEVLALRLPERHTIDGEIRYRRPVSYAAMNGAMLTDWPL
ncbi:hypothetical protein SAMN06297251_11799 [Fulvimarina manganoxydans]|uniref:Lipoprotein n=1 Tax=Fulvimarina manganoxydans TaxID=937218 RepID=A0A1W2DU60_9HYPH|nr:hypothetical protein [Fulvimarina manganoxydans]SMD00562.1 hypothetical protein SAMN06297251_11799 [Fulvimarina manganoxydans]